MGVQLGPFVLEAFAARGGMGVVWRGRWEGHAVPVAVKLLTRDRPGTLPLAFASEARAMAGLDHPHVVRVLDYGVLTEGVEVPGVLARSPWLAMEWASQGALRPSALQTWPEVEALLVCLLDALGHAHARGVLHRDLKPANILLCGPEDLRPGPKLADFGVARVGGDTALHAGTPAYMAPEQLARRVDDEGPWTDLYALGCVAWELLMGAPPGGALRSPFAPRMAAPERIAAWLATLLAPSPQDRFPTAADARAALHGLGPLQPPALQTPARRQGAALTVPLGLGGSTYTLDDPTPQPPVARTGPPPALRSLGVPTPDDATPTDVRLRGAGLGVARLRRPPMVGRADERRALLGALSDAMGDNLPRVVVLEGASGNGRTRLAAWLCERVHETGAATPVWAEHHDPPAAGDGLVAALARQIGEAPGQAREERLHDRIPGMEAQDALDLARWMDGEPPSVRFPLLARALRAWGRGRPVVVALDDAEADPLALGFALWVLRRAEAGTPLLIVLPVRPEALVGRIAEAAVLAEIRGLSGAVPVPPLPDEEIASLIADRVGLAASAALRVAARVGGNPGLAVALTDAWVDAGLVVPDPDGGKLSVDPEALAIPAASAELWARRLDAAMPSDSPDRPALVAGAVLGVAFSWREWAAVLGRLAIAAPRSATVDTLLAAGLLHIEGDRWTWAHAAVRDALLASAGALVCEDHAAAAEVLSNAVGTALRVGRHWMAAGRPDEAIAPFGEAVAHAFESSDAPGAEVALDLAARALDAAGVPEDDPRRAVWLRNRSVAALFLGRAADAVALATAALHHPAARTWELRWKAAHALLRALRPLAPAQALAVGLPIYEEAALHPEGGGRLRLATVLSRLLVDQGDRARARVMLTECASDPASDEYRAHFLLEVADLWRVDGDRAGALQALAEVRRLLSGSRTRWALAEADNQRGALLCDEGQIEAGLAAYGEALYQLERLDSGDVPVVALNVALVYLDLGRDAEAEALARRCEATFRRRGYAAMRMASAVVLCDAVARRGGWTEIEALLPEIGADAAATGLVDIGIARPLARVAARARDAGQVEIAAVAGAMAEAQERALRVGPDGT